MRYPDKFHIQPTVETRRGSGFVYTDDVTNQPFVFMGRIKIVPPTVLANLHGDLTRATHILHCPVLDFDVQIGLTVYDYSSEKDYEILLPEPGQRGMKLWVALT